MKKLRRNQFRNILRTYYQIIIFIYLFYLITFTVYTRGSLKTRIVFQSY